MADGSDHSPIVQTGDIENADFTINKTVFENGELVEREVDTDMDTDLVEDFSKEVEEAMDEAIEQLSEEAAQEQSSAQMFADQVLDSSAMSPVSDSSGGEGDVSDSGETSDTPDVDSVDVGRSVVDDRGLNSRQFDAFEAGMRDRGLGGQARDVWATLTNEEGYVPAPDDSLDLSDSGGGDDSSSNAAAGDAITLPSRVESGRWDAAAVARPDGDYGEKHDILPLPEDARRYPDVELTDAVVEEMESQVSGVPAWQYEDGDVVAVFGVDDGVRGRTDLRTVDMSPGPELLRERATDFDGDLDIDYSDGWVGVHPADLHDLSEGDLQSGWDTSPIKDASRPSFRVGWSDDVGTDRHYRETHDPPYFVYNYDTETDSIDVSDSIGKRSYAAVYRKPDGDEFIGLDPETDGGQRPMEPLLRSEYEDQYDLDPYIQSADGVAELVGEDILIRNGSGWLYETEVAGELDDGAGFYVPERVYPDGKYYIPASSNHSDSDFALVGVADGDSSDVGGGGSADTPVAAAREIVEDNEITTTDFVTFQNAMREAGYADEASDAWSDLRDEDAIPKGTVGSGGGGGSESDGGGESESDDSSGGADVDLPEEMVLLTTTNCPGCAALKQELDGYLDGDPIVVLDIMESDRAADLAAELNMMATPTLLEKRDGEWSVVGT